MSFPPIPTTCPSTGSQSSPTSNKFVYVDSTSGATSLGNSPPADDTPICSFDQRTNCAFQCTSGKYVGFSSNFNDGPRYMYVDVKDSLANDIRFGLGLRHSGPSTHDPDGFIGGFGSGRDRSHTMNVGPLPLFIGEGFEHGARRYLTGMGSARNALLGTNPNGGGSYPLVGSYGRPWM